MALASALGDKPGETGARLRLRFIEMAGRGPPGTRLLKQSLAMHEQFGDGLGVCRLLVFLGVAMTQLPESRQQGRMVLQRAVDLARELGDEWGKGFALAFLGWAELEAGDREPALRRLREALLSEALGPVRGSPLEGLGALALEHDAQRTLRLYAGRDRRARARRRPATRVTQAQNRPGMRASRAAARRTRRRAGPGTTAGQ